jgi:RNA polymerase sigma-70 factor, ECF subfamily
MRINRSQSGGSEITLDWPVQRTTGTVTLEERIAELFEQLREPLYRYILMITNDPERSEELTQDCFLRLHLRLQARDSVDNVKAWLFRVAHNLAIDSARRTGGRESVVEPEAWQRFEATRADAALDPEQSMLAGERLRQVDRAIEKLSPQQRACLHLRAEGFRYREIAEILGVRESTITENLRRALARLMKELHVS